MKLARYIIGLLIFLATISCSTAAPYRLLGDTKAPSPGMLSAVPANTSVLFESAPVITVAKVQNSSENVTWNSFQKYTPVVIGQFSITTDSDEIVDINSITIKAEGTGDDAVDISLVRLILDKNGNGLIDENDQSLGDGYYNIDDGTSKIHASLIPFTQSDAPINIFITYYLNADAPLGSTFCCSVVGMDAMTTDYEPVSIAGLPVSSSQLTVVENPPHVEITNLSDIRTCWWESKGSISNKMMWIKAEAKSDYPIRINSVQLQGTGYYGNMATDVSAVELWADNNENGEVDNSDELIGTGNYAADDDKCTIQALTELIIPARSAKKLLICYKMASCIVSDQPKFYSFNIDSMDARIVESGLVVPTIGLPMWGTGSLVVVDQPPTLSFSQYQNMPDDNGWWRGYGSSPKVVLRFRARPENTECVYLKDFTVQAYGTGDDVKDIESVDIWLDANCNGLLDSEDWPIIKYKYLCDDGTCTFNLDGFGQFVDRDYPSLYSYYLITYSMNTNVTNGKTYGCKLVGASGTDSNLGVDVQLTGIPLQGTEFTVIEENPPSLSIAFGPKSPVDHVWWQGVQGGKELAQLVINSNANEDISLTEIRLGTSCSISDATSQVMAFLDVNRNGVVDAPEDVILATAQDGGDEYSSYKEFNFGDSGITIPARGSVCILIVCDIANINDMYLPGYVGVGFCEASAKWVSSGAAAPVYGLPINGAELVVIGKPHNVNIGEAKRLGSNSWVQIDDVIVTGGQGGNYCVEESGRSAGIQIYNTPSSLQLGDRITLYGKLSGDGGNSSIWVAFDKQNGHVTPLKPVAMCNLAIGGAPILGESSIVNYCNADNPIVATGVNNVGLLVKTWGRVTESNEFYECFYIDDGSGL